MTSTAASRRQVMLFVALLLSLLLLGPLSAQSTTITPSLSPTSSPTSSPVVSPTSSPVLLLPLTVEPTVRPTMPTRAPSPPTTRRPSRSPVTRQPTALNQPTTSYPTPPSTQQPTRSPSSSQPSQRPSHSPSTQPTFSAPSFAPTTSRPSVRPTSSPTRSPAPSSACAPLVGSSSEGSAYGQVCLYASTSNAHEVELKYEFAPEYASQVHSTAAWVGMNPTVIPTREDGQVDSTAALFIVNQTAALAIPLLYSEFTTNCQVYAMAQASLLNGTTVVQLGAGGVRFSSTSRMFALPVACVVRTQQPTLQPTPSPVDIFNVQFKFVGPLPPHKPLMTGLTHAVSRLQSLLPVDYATSMCLPANHTLCGVAAQDAPLCFDDLLLVVHVLPENATLSTSTAADSALVRTCVVNPGTQQVRVAYLEIEDSSSSSSSFYSDDLVFHLLLQAVGFGHRWRAWGLLTDTEEYYQGKSATQQYVQLGGSPAAAGIPVAASSPPLWSAAALGANEMMTPWTSQQPRLLSSISIAALLDLNFLQVDLSQASASYALPAAPPSRRRRLQTADEPTEEEDVVVDELPGEVKPDRQSDYEQEQTFAEANFPGMRTRQPTPTPGNSNNIKGDDGGLDGGAIAGIVIGVLVAVCLLCLCLYCVLCQRCCDRDQKDKKKKADKKASTGGESKWVEKTDGERTYWINEETGEFSWTPPVGVGISAAASAAADTAAKLPPPSVAAASKRAAQQQQLQGEWTEMMDESGNPFWVNDDTGEFSWVPPANSSGMSKPLSSAVKAPKPQQQQPQQTVAVRMDPEVDYDKYLSRADQPQYNTHDTSNMDSDDDSDDDDDDIPMSGRGDLISFNHAIDTTRTSRADSTPNAPPPPIPSQRRSSLLQQHTPSSSSSAFDAYFDSAPPVHTGKSRAFAANDDEEDDFFAQLPPPPANTSTQQQRNMVDSRGNPIWKEDYDML